MATKLRYTSEDSVTVGVFRVDLEIREDKKARRFRVQRADGPGTHLMCAYKDELEDLADAVDEMIARVESKEQRSVGT